MTVAPTVGAPVLTAQEAEHLRMDRGLAPLVRGSSMRRVRIGRRILTLRRQLEALLEGTR